MFLDNYEIFKRDIYSLTTIDLNAYKERQMLRRIDALISKHGYKTYKEFVEALKVDKQLFETFVAYLTINVSEFYRNPEQWNVLEKDILPDIINKKGNNIKIWSAACSTGDEPYSLAMLLSKFIQIDKIRIIATDIDSQILDKARLGIYNEKSLTGLPTEFKSKFFSKIGDHAFKIDEKVKNAVTFKKHNLLRDSFIPDCDLIVCRNVLIYFTEEAKREIYIKFNSSLSSDGILFVGSTEQIIQPQDINYMVKKPFFYGKCQ